MTPGAAQTDGRGRGYRVVVGVEVGDEDGADPGQNLVHGVAVVAAELAERPLAAVQQQRGAGAEVDQRPAHVPHLHGQGRARSQEHHLREARATCGETQRRRQP